ncbi:MAG: CBS domain-containing protein [Desulfobacteraceae bacterium]
MTLCAKDVMVTAFDKIDENASIEQAIQMISNGKVRKTGHKTISLMVTDYYDNLVGVITMFDILYHLRPGFLNYGIDGDQLPWQGQLDNFIRDLKAKKVKQVMSTDVMGASLDEHLMVLLDRMIKNKYRRLPVLENNKPIGVVYISDIYFKLF